MSAKERRKACLLVQYIEFLERLEVSEPVIVLMRDCDIVLGLPWLDMVNREIDRNKCRLTAPRTANVLQRVQIPQRDHACPLPDYGSGNRNDQPATDVQLLGASTFSHLLVMKEVVKPFAIRLGECQGFLGASPA